MIGQYFNLCFKFYYAVWSRVQVCCLHQGDVPDGFKGKLTDWRQMNCKVGGQRDERSGPGPSGQPPAHWWMELLMGWSHSRRGSADSRHHWPRLNSSLRAFCHLCCTIAAAALETMAKAEGLQPMKRPCLNGRNRDAKKKKIQEPVGGNLAPKLTI